MVDIKWIMRATGKSEKSIRAKSTRMRIKPHYKAFTKQHIEVEYTDDEAEELIIAINSQKKYRYDEKDML
jgi:hypothetical protein